MPRWCRSITRSTTTSTPSRCTTTFTTTSGSTISPATPSLDDLDASLPDSSPALDAAGAGRRLHHDVRPDLSHAGRPGPSHRRRRRLGRRGAQYPPPAGTRPAVLGAVHALRRQRAARQLWLLLRAKRAGAARHPGALSRDGPARYRRYRRRAAAWPAHGQYLRLQARLSFRSPRHALLAGRALGPAVLARSDAVVLPGL